MLYITFYLKEKMMGLNTISHFSHFLVQMSLENVAENDGKMWEIHGNERKLEQRWKFVETKDEGKTDFAWSLQVISANTT